MTLDSIDLAVDMVVAGLIYGSGTWFVCAFGLYVVSRRRKRQAMRPVLLLAPALEPAVVEPFELDDSLSEAIVLTSDERIDVAPNIEIIIEQPLLIAPAAQPELFPEKSIEKVPGKESMGKKAIEKESIEGIEEKPVAALPDIAEIDSADIVCEPVDWKKWRVADLRKASLAKTCGVRTRPIGSKRNLLKADLIAQYEQQLKRFTRPSAQDKVQERRIA